ncbi:MAG: DoxX family protein [Bacteroidaceae bacterium]|nr:DoxX family protein [Bacteroidaceae bacterium]
MSRDALHIVLKIVVNICRFLLAATFLFSGFVKANDPLGMVYKLEDYFSAWGITGVPELFTLLMAMGIALFEFVLGVYLFFGMRRKWVSRITLVFMAMMTLLTVYIAIANPVSDCGCFGDAIILTNVQTLLKNIVLLGAAIVVFRWYRLQPHLINTSVYWIVSTLFTLGLLAYMMYCIYALPVIDFRPYKVGTDLRTMVEVPEDQRPQFEVTIIYEKDGKTLELSIDDDDPDSTWTYVETRRKQISGASQHIINDFYIEYGDEEVTGDILAYEGSTLLLCAPDLQTADESIMDKINDLYDYAQANDIMYYCLTASDEATRSRWADYTGAEYLCLTADDRTLKTMVRSNPGLILLHDGRIIKKWSHWNFPAQEEIQGLISPSTPSTP